MTSIDFITIDRQTGASEDIDRSTLAVIERDSRTVEVIGVLPHGSRWRPASERDRDALVAWLESLRYDEVMT